MITQLTAIAASLAVLVLVYIFVILSVCLSYGQTLKQWQNMVIFWSSVLVFLFLTMYILMSWPDNGKPPTYRYVPVHEQLYRFERVGLSDSLKLQ